MASPTTASNTDEGEKGQYVHKILSRQCTLVLATREMHINAIAHSQSRFFGSGDEVTDCPHSSLPSSELRDEESAMMAAKTCNEENEAKVSIEGETEATVSNEEEQEEDDANMNPGSPLPNSTPKKRQTQTATDAIERRRSPQLNKGKTTKKLHNEHGHIPPSSSEERNSMIIAMIVSSLVRVQSKFLR